MGSPHLLSPDDLRGVWAVSIRLGEAAVRPEAGVTGVPPFCVVCRDLGAGVVGVVCSTARFCPLWVNNAMGNNHEVSVFTRGERTNRSLSSAVA